MPSDASDDPDVEGLAEPRSTRSRFKIVLIALGLLFVVALAASWFSRERIAGNLIASELEKRAIPATFRIVSIGAREQELADVVIGDPRKPDFTAERVFVSVRPRLGMPAIAKLRLVRPRLYGAYLDGELSFGALDPLVFASGEEPFRLPAMNLAIEQGRALIESEYGALGVQFDGGGPLRDGFAGELAAIAPGAGHDDCTTDRVTAYGKVTVSDGKPRFEGPARMFGLACPRYGFRLARLAVGVDVVADRAFEGAEGVISLSASGLDAARSRIAGMGGTARAAWRDGRVRVAYGLAASGMQTPQFVAPGIVMEGSARARDDLASVDLDAGLSGDVAGLGGSLAGGLGELAEAGKGTPVEALARKAGRAMLREARGATFSLQLVARRRHGADTLVVPQARLVGSSGQPVVSLSRFRLRGEERSLEAWSGNFMTGGRDLPRISGRVRKAPRGMVLDMSMADYAAGDARLAIPRLVIAQAPGGLRLAGEARVSGTLPGGHADRLVTPIDGDWSDRAGLALWRRCADLRFERLRLSGLQLSRQALRVCPPRGTAILRSGPAGLKIAAGAPSLRLSGHLGGTPIRISSGPVGFAWPGNLAARALDVNIGPRERASSLRIDRLSARLGQEISGRFEGAAARLDAVPLDLTDLSGRWCVARGALTLTDASLRVSDRTRVDRFAPLLARDARLTLRDNSIVVRSLLREPGTDREVLGADIRHDLASGRGWADLTVDEIRFDRSLQPDTLTPLALGVIANARGALRGKGRIDWSETGISSSGRFSTDSLDFAAAFGPVRGVSGELVFTDLLGLVTAPGQTLRVASINPGIEVNDGVIEYALQPGNVLALTNARWPFIDGTLELQPVSIAFTSDKPARFVLVIEGIDSARFVQRLELGNIAASGTFDGRLPLVFDQDGGRIEGGRLESRAPGGNVSYVGELTYEDLSPMANFAFAALRSIDYRKMRIELDGALDGEIITRVVFDGISQGVGASRNLLTRRIAGLPIRFRLNIRAPFMQLVSSTRSLYDPAYIRDPRELGIAGFPGPAAPARPGEGRAAPPVLSQRSSRTDVQAPESGGMP